MAEMTLEQRQAVALARARATAESESTGMPMARIPAFAETSPNLYKGLVSAREMLGPTVEALGAAGGGALGLAGGPPGAALGAGLGYGVSKELLNMADVGLGLKPPRTGTQAIVDPAQNVAEGAFFEGVAGPVIKGASKVFDIGKGATLKAKNILKETLGGVDINATRNMLGRAGDDLTAAQALEGIDKPAFQALADRVSGRTVTSAGAKYTTKDAQEAARRVGIQNVTPDLADSIKLRDQISKPFYETADKAVIKIDDELKTIFDRMPADTLKKAAEIAKMEGRPFIMGTRKPAGTEPTGLLDAAGNPIMRPTPAEIPEITGESMHFIKRALSDIANAPASTQGIGRDTQAAAKGVLNDFITGFETRVPAYGEGRKLFSEASGPVNQAKVLDAMMKVLDQPGGGERVMPFLNALGRGETALLKKSTGFPRYETGDLSKILTPEQMKSVDDAVSQMTRDIRISDQAATGRDALRDVLSDNMKMLRLPSLINFKVAATNAMLDTIERKVGRKVMDTLTESLQTAKTAEELLSKLPANERIKVLNVIYDTAANSKPTQRAIRTGVKEAATQDEEGNPFAYAGGLITGANKLAPPTLYQNRNSLRP
jgi:hypothetical protein